MGRHLSIRKVRKSEINKLHKILEQEITNWQRRRAETILLFAGGLNAIEIAKLLAVHSNTVYKDLHAFNTEGIKSIEQARKVGSKASITEKQIKEIVQIANQTPVELGLPYGRWSLNKLRQYLKKQRIVKKISLMHLWRLLKKGGCTFGDSSANSKAMILNATRSSIE